MSLLLLVVAVLALAVGPGLAALGARAGLWRVGFDGFAMVLVSGLCLLYLVPHALEHGGALAALAGLIGALLPLALERLGGRLVRFAELTGLVLLVVHAMLDGAALAVLAGGSAASVGLAVAAHRLPVGFALVNVASRGRTRAAGRRVVWLTVAVLGVATIGGFLLGGPLAQRAPDVLLGVIEGGVAGFLLHVVLDTPELPGGRQAARERPWAVGGALIAVLGLLGLVAAGPGDGQLHAFTETVHSWLRIAHRIGSPVVLGFGLLAALRLLPQPARWWRKLPPVLTLDAFLASVALLGWPLALARLVGAVGVIAMARVVVRGRLRDVPPQTDVRLDPSRPGHPGRPSLASLLLEPADRSVPWLLTGITVAAIAAPYVDAERIGMIPAPLHVPLFTVLGLVFPAAATGITPVAAVVGTQGVSAGAVVALALAGTSAYASTLGLLLPRGNRSRAVRVGLGVVLTCLVVGWSVDLADLQMPSFSLGLQGPVAELLGWAGAILLGAATLASLLRLGPRALVGRVVAPRRTREAARRARP